MSLICSSSLLIGQPLLDTSNIEHVNVIDSDTTYNRNVTAFITYYNSIDSCINLFTSNNIQDYDTLFISEKENLIIYKYEKSPHPRLRFPTLYFCSRFHFQGRFRLFHKEIVIS